MAAGGFAQPLPPPLKAVLQGKSPAVPPLPWNVRPAGVPFSLHADIEDQLQERILKENGNLFQAIQVAQERFRQDIPPEVKERELIATVLLLARAIKTFPDSQIQQQFRQQLLSLASAESESYLWNHTEVLQIVFEALFGENYRLFSNMYGYQPHAMSDALMLNPILSRLPQNGVLSASPYVRMLWKTKLSWPIRFIETYAHWARLPSSESQAILDTANKVAAVAPGYRLGTEQALNTLFSLSQPSGQAQRSAFDDPMAGDFVRRLDGFMSIPLPLDQLTMLMPHRNRLGMTMLLDGPTEWRDAIAGFSAQHVLLMVDLLESPQGWEKMKLLKAEYGYRLSSSDVPMILRFGSLEDLRRQLHQARQLYGGLPPMTNLGLQTLLSLDRLDASKRLWLQRIFRNSKPPETYEIANTWIGLAQSHDVMMQALHLTPEQCLARVDQLKAIGWDPGEEREAGLFWVWQGPQAPMAAARSLFEKNGWRLRFHMRYALQGLSEADWQRLERLPTEAQVERFLLLPGEFLTSLKSNPGLWDFFAQLLERGYLSGSLIEDVYRDRWAYQRDVLYALLQSLNQEVGRRGWSALETLHLSTEQPAAHFLVYAGMKAYVFPGVQVAGSSMPQFRIVPDFQKWFLPEMLGKIRLLSGRTGYRLSLGDTDSYVRALTEDPDRIAKARAFHLRTGMPLTRPIMEILQDPALAGQLEDPLARSMRALLEQKGYQWTPADTAFIYQLGRSARWRARIIRLKSLSPDMREVRFAFLQEQLRRPALRQQIRRVLAADASYPYGELAGYLIFDEKGNLVLRPIPGRGEHGSNPLMNVSYAYRPLDLENSRWFVGRWFGFWHNHIIPESSPLSRASPGDRTTARTFDRITPAFVIFAGSLDPSEAIVVGAYTAQSPEQIFARFFWTEPRDLLFYAGRILGKIRPAIPKALRPAPPSATASSMPGPLTARLDWGASPERELGIPMPPSNRREIENHLLRRFSETAEVQGLGVPVEGVSSSRVVGDDLFELYLKKHRPLQELCAIVDLIAARIFKGVDIEGKKAQIYVFVVSGYPCREIAEYFGLGLQTVYGYACDARQALKRSYGQRRWNPLFHLLESLGFPALAAQPSLSRSFIRELLQQPELQETFSGLTETPVKEYAVLRALGLMDPEIAPILGRCANTASVQMRLLAVSMRKFFQAPSTESVVIMLAPLLREILRKNPHLLQAA